jgi:hypothetical protein
MPTRPPDLRASGRGPGPALRARPLCEYNATFAFTASLFGLDAVGVDAVERRDARCCASRDHRGVQRTRHAGPAARARDGKEDQDRATVRPHDAVPRAELRRGAPDGGSDVPDLAWRSWWAEIHSWWYLVAGCTRATRIACGDGSRRSPTLARRADTSSRSMGQTQHRFSNFRTGRLERFVGWRRGRSCLAWCRTTVAGAGSRLQSPWFGGQRPWQLSTLWLRLKQPRADRLSGTAATALQRGTAAAPLAAAPSHLAWSTRPPCPVRRPW